jgi:phosphoglycerate dehydrogenase-like enzyme
MKGKILVTPRSVTRDGHPALERLTEEGYELVFSTPGVQPDEAELIRLLPGCDGYLAGVERISASVLAAAKGLRVISRNGVGVENIDLAAADRLGVRVCTTPGANSRGVAELTLALILSLVRSVPFGDAALKDGGWERRRGIEVRGRTLGVVGCGRIGKEVACLALAVGLKVVAYDLEPDLTFRPAGDFGYARLDELLVASDIVTLHCPLPSDRRPLIDAAAIAAMKRGAYLVNTARAGLVDESSALEALEDDRLGGLAVDVFHAEPPGDHPLVKHPKVIATPHVGGFTDESVARAIEGAVENLLKALAL